MTHAALLLMALILDAVAGEPRLLWDRLPHPAVLLGRAVSWLDRNLNDGGSRRIRGALAIATLAVAAATLGVAVAKLPLGPLWEVLIAAVLMAQRSLAEHVRAVADAVALSTREGRRLVARIVGRDTQEMDASAVARGAIESAAENLSDGVVAPAFWFLVFGLPGILIYKAINTADSMIGHRTERYEEFGWAAARLDDVMNWAPARITALMILISGGHPDRWRAVVAEAPRHRSPNAGWPEAAMAQVLGVALSGPRRYGGVLTDDPFVNEHGNQDLGPSDIDASVTILWRVWWLMIAAIIILAVV